MKENKYRRKARISAIGTYTETNAIDRIEFFLNLKQNFFIFLYNIYNI